MANDTKGDRTLDAAVVLGMMFMLCAAVFLLAFISIPKDNMTLFAALTSGVIGTSVGSYFGYRFGSSKGSADKDEVIASQLPKADGQ